MDRALVVTTINPLNKVFKEIARGVTCSNIKSIIIRHKKSPDEFILSVAYSMILIVN